MIGKRLLHYEIREQLGQGGMGQVYLAHDSKLGRDVALKVMSESAAEDAEWRSRFMREARAIAALKHPNIVTIHAVEEADGVLFIVMELVEGRPFSELIPKNGMDAEHLFAYAAPLADAMASAHDRNITHRDLKPANVMLDADGRIKVLDFGLAKLMAPAETAEDAETVVRTSDTAVGMVLGTAAYMSPEQAEGKPIDHRSDIFSLGIVLYEMATGARPFTGDTRISTISSILKDEPTRVTQINQALPHHLGRIIHRCLEKDPDRRYQSAKDVRNEIESLKKEVDSGQLLESSVITPPSGAHPAAVVPPSDPGSGVQPPPPPYGHAPAPGPRPARRGLPPVAVLGMAAVALVVIAWLVFRMLAPGGPEMTSVGEKPTVATSAGAKSGKKMTVVLPFENLGPPEEAYFAAGVTEEITSRLSRVSDLGVISRTSAVNYDRSGKTIREVGEDLGVDYVLEGSVRWAAGPDGVGRVRITPQLVRVADDTHVWSDTYDRDVSDIFEVQTEIATHVVDALGVTLLGEERERIAERPTDNMDAYELYLKAGDFQLTGETSPGESDRRIVDMYERVVELDPNFVAAWYKLARHHADMYRGFDRTETRLSRARVAVEGAEAADPDHFFTHMARGYYDYYGFRDYERALEEFRAARQLDPNNAEAMAAIGYILRRQGKFEDSIETHRAALQVDPRNFEIIMNLLATHRAIRDFEGSFRLVEHALEVAPYQFRALIQKAELLRQTGDLEGAEKVLGQVNGRPMEYIFAKHGIETWRRDYRAAYETIAELPGDAPVIRGLRLVFMGRSYVLAGDGEAGRAQVEEGAKILEQVTAVSPTSWQVRQPLAAAYSILGRHDEAVAQAKAAVELSSKDKFSSPQATQTLAIVYAQGGRHEEAIDLIEKLLQMNYEDALTQTELELDPGWDPLRENPRFQAIVNAPSEL